LSENLINNLLHQSWTYCKCGIYMFHCRHGGTDRRLCWIV